MDIRTIKLSELNPAKYNPRKDLKPGDPEYDKLKRSIEQFGYVEPVIWNKTTGRVVGGHQRLKVLIDMGITEVDCVVVELPEDKEKALNIALNKISGDWDKDKLALLIADLQGADFDVSLTGFDPAELDDLFKASVKDKIKDDDFDVDAELKQPPVTKPGDIWTLGRHRLVCGDSCNSADVEKLMGEEKADLVFTDPPYGCGFENKGVLNDNQNQNDLTDFNKQWIPLTFKALKANGSWYCWGIDESVMRIYAFILLPMIEKGEITFRNLLTWDKGLGQNQNDENMRSYAAADEKCLFVMCGVQDYNNNKDHYDEAFEPVRSYLEGEAKRAGLTSKLLTEITGVQMYGHWFTKSQFTIIPEIHYKKLQAYYNGTAFDMDYDKLRTLFNAEGHETFCALKQEWYNTRAYFNNTHDNMNNVWHFPRTDAEERKLTGGHATPKPIALCSRAIKSSSREGEIVLDVFGGSGSTLIACELVKRKALLMELEPMWCDVIVKRYVKLTGDTSCYCITSKGHRVEYADAFGE